MAYLTTIVENLAVICNPVWVVDANRKWMESTQQLIIAYQRIEAFQNKIAAVDNALREVKQTSSDDAANKSKCPSSVNCKNVTLQQEWLDRATDPPKITSIHIESKFEVAVCDSEELKCEPSASCPPTSSSDSR